MVLADDWRSEFAVMTITVSLAALITVTYSVVRPGQRSITNEPILRRAV